MDKIFYKKQKFEKLIFSSKKNLRTLKVAQQCQSICYKCISNNKLNIILYICFKKM